MSGPPALAADLLAANTATATGRVPPAVRIIVVLMASALAIERSTAARTVVVGSTRTMRTAMVIGIVGSLGGLLLTVYVDLLPGGVIVQLTVAVYALGPLVRTLRNRPASATAPTVAAEG